MKEGCEFPEKLQKNLYVANEETLLNMIINWSPMSNLKQVRESPVTRKLARKTLDKMIQMKMITKMITYKRGVVNGRS